MYLCMYMFLCMFVSPNFIRDLSIGQKKKLVWFHIAKQNQKNNSRIGELNG
jgi:hypothetical protein